MSNVLLYGRENVHPLFDPNRFAPGIDYNGAIYDSAVLATRLINSPQGFQHDYCFFYGKNVPTNAPANWTELTSATSSSNETAWPSVFASKSTT
jgi:hypothetical protein